MRGLVFGLAPGDFHRVGRTERSLTAAGVSIEQEPALTAAALAGKLRAATGPLLIARAGGWLVEETPLAIFPASATGRPVIGLGAIRNSREWRQHLARCGGDLQRPSWLPPALPEAGFFYLEKAALDPFAGLLEEGHAPRAALQRLSRDRRYRAVHLAALDSYDDTALRVLQLVTTIQLGGAERVTLDLAEELQRQGVRVCVAALGRPTRLAFPEPAHFVDFSHVPATPEARADAVIELARAFGADLVHGHLIRADEARAIKAHGLPLTITLHNLPPAWPAGFHAADAVCDFVFACSRAVEKEWRQRGSADVHSPPIRTVWNGIDARPFAPSDALRTAATAWRSERGWNADDFILTAVANPRPQKRLHLLPEILRELQMLLAPRAARLVIVGAHAERSADARQSVAEVEAAISRYGVGEDVHWTGGTGAIATLLSASNALVSASAFEGLSLAHLEALAAGVPVVATAVGGTTEIASPLVHLVAPDAEARTFAKILATLPRSTTAREPALPAHFTRHRMAARTRSLYPRIIERSRALPLADELWLITNNFSTGGAQSSARRLLLGLAERGEKVRAFTVQEAPSNPTPGRLALSRAGIPVAAIPPPKSLDAAEAVAHLLDLAAPAPPRAVLFWNLITSYKVLLADAFFDTPIYDVSPGEMYFSSLDKYFADPRPALPYLTPRDYGARLAGIVVKYATESATAAALGAPVHFIRNGVALAPPGAARRPRSTGKFIIGTAARLSPDKRLEDLLEALRLALPRLPRCELRIAGGSERGSESYARELRRQARGLPVKWCGELRHTAAFLANLDLFAMISEPAGCPNASLEAMAAGLPIVATEVGGAREQILDGITGRLTARGDHPAFAAALVELAGDAEKRMQFGTAAAAHVRENFSVNTMIESYRNLCFAVRSPNTAANANGAAGMCGEVPDFFPLSRGKSAAKV